MDKLIEKIIALKNPTAVGIDTDVSYLPQDVQAGLTNLEDAAQAVYNFNVEIIDAVYDLVPAVKVQMAFYEALGSAGVKVFEKTVAYAESKGLYVIADVKRNDIGSTATAYAQSYFSGVQIGGKRFIGCECDCMTVNGYLGSDGIKPFVKACAEYDKDIFSLVKTSNPSSGELQDLNLESGEKVYVRMGHMVEEWGKDTIGKYGYSRVGAVVGATHPTQAQELRAALPHTFFLIPGYGAQGGTAEDLKVCFDERGLGGIVNSSRGIICAYKQEKYKGLSVGEAARAAVIDMRDDLARVIRIEA